MSKVQLYARDGYPYHKATSKEILSAIKVKALELEKLDTGNYVSVKGNYSIGLYDDDIPPYWSVSVDGEEISQHDSFAQAYTALQAHHEQHVLSMIETEETQ